MKDCKTILQLSSEFLKKHYVKRPRFVAEILLSNFLKLKRIELYMYFDRLILEEELTLFRKALKRASLGEPVEYILGEVEFYHASIKVTPDVLIPRQETEILLDLVCKRITGKEKKALDLCTGSGCLAIGLKKTFPQIDMTGIDISKKALAIANQNARDIRWLLGNLTLPVRGETFDLILCNPPYVSEEEYEKLERQVREFEPREALIAGPSGYEFYEKLQEELPLILADGGKVFFEIGKDQGEKVKKIFSKSFWKDLQIEKDWAGHDRFFSLNLSK